MPNLPCNRCLYVGAPTLRWHQTSTGLAHLGAYCPECHAWIKWVPQTREWTSSAPDRALMETQERLL